MTCQSCAHTRPHGCALEQPLWPLAGPDCDRFAYAPGSDEAEDTDDDFAEDWL